MTNEELISKYYDGNMQALYDLYEQNVGFIQSVAAAVAKDYKNYLRFSDTFEDLVQVDSLTFFEKLKAKLKISVLRQDFHIPISQKYKDAASCIMKVCQIRIYPRSLA